MFFKKYLDKKHNESYDYYIKKTINKKENIGHEKEIIRYPWNYRFYSICSLVCKRRSFYLLKMYLDKIQTLVYNSIKIKIKIKNYILEDKNMKNKLLAYGFELWQVETLIKTKKLNAIHGSYTLIGKKLVLTTATEKKTIDLG